MGVSILVLLDLLLKLLGRGFDTRRDTSFNPCFTGFTSKTISTAEVVTRGTEFQSLFYWIMLSNMKIANDVLVERLCFNPCFTGLCSQTLLLFLKAPHPLKFQSLFYWIMLSNMKIANDVLVERLCFNPCFTGLCSQTKTIALSEETKERLEFQSLFYWIMLSNSFAFSESTTSSEVSILVLLDYALKQPEKLLQLAK